MSCRVPAGGRAASAAATAITGISANDTPEIMHRIRRQYRERGFTHTASPEQIVAVMEGIAFRVRSDRSMSEGRRARVLAKIDAAITAANNGTGPSVDVATIYVWRDLISQIEADRQIRVEREAQAQEQSAQGETGTSAAEARQARNAEVAARRDSYIAMVAAADGLTPEQVHAEWQRIFNQDITPREEQHLREVHAIIGEADDDIHTRHAAYTIGSRMRCANCGRYTTPLRYHECPLLASDYVTPLPPDSWFDDDEEEYESDWSYEEPIIYTEPAPYAPPVHTAPTDTRPLAGDPTVPWDMDEFQTEWDAAKARIAAGNTRIPAFPDKEALPGGVTGGLGLDNTYGIELEIDFPDDSYPYQAREEFARRLHALGISRSDHVEPWHHVGDGRRGGTFTKTPSEWVPEFDRSVDDQGGLRGVEIKSQILIDEPVMWQNLDKICEVAESLGGRATTRTGLHINVGGAQFDPEDTAAHTRLLRLAAAFDDTIIRLAHNPESGERHRGRDFCHLVQVPPEGFTDINTVRYRAGHYQSFNMAHLPGPGERAGLSTRVEHRVWDSTLDARRIQLATVVSMALVEAAHRGIELDLPVEPAGTHRRTYGRRRLQEQEWEASTESFRRLVSLIASLTGDSKHIKTALTTAFASTVWQKQ